MSRVPLHRGAAVAAVIAVTLTAAGATAQPPTGGLLPRDIAARAQASLLVVRAIGVRGDTLGEGTGFVVGPDGTFVTNYHLVEPAAKVEVEPLDGRPTRRVLLVAADPHRDLAILRAPETPLRRLALGDDGRAVIGDRVYVMGNPMGMSGTFTDGLVSARRPVQGTAMLQISAPISAGSSGGPVMNDRGEVIGVATMMVVGGQNLNLAVPTRYVRPLLLTTDVPRPFTAEALPRRERDAVLAAMSRPSAAGPPPAAGDVWRRQVLAQIALADSVMRLNGMRLAGPVRLGAAAQGGRGVEAFAVEAGARYVLIARCDADCTRLDLGMVDPDGATIASAPGDDDFPALSFVARANGTHRAVVGMSACSMEPCAYGVALYRLATPRVSLRDH